MATIRKFCGKWERHRSHMKHVPHPIVWSARMFTDDISSIDTIGYDTEVCHGFPTPYGTVYPDGTAPTYTASGRLTTQRDNRYARMSMEDLLALLQRAQNVMDVPNGRTRRVVWRVRRWAKERLKR